MDDQKDRLSRETMDLVGRAVHGNQEAISALYDLYKNRLEGAIRAKLGRKLRYRMETQDLIQTLWKDVLSELDDFQYQGVDSFFRWLQARLVWKIRDKAKYFGADKRDAERERRVNLDDTLVKQASAAKKDQTPGHAAILSEEMDELQRLLKHLPDIQRKVVLLRLKEERDFEDIGKALGKSAGAARKLYARGIKRLGELIIEGRKGKKTI